MPRRSWSTEEDESLRGAVATHGVKAWSAVSCALPGRTGKACRERWFGHLNPALVPERWSEPEDSTLFGKAASYPLSSRIGRRFADSRARAVACSRAPEARRCVG